MNSYLVSAVRTPIGKFLGSLAEFAAPQLGAFAVREAMRRANVSPGNVDEVILGHVVQAGCGQNPARQAALAAGLPNTIDAHTTNMVCGSGLKAVMLADRAIRCGDAHVVVAGGMESMSRAPFLLPNVRGGYKYGDQTAVDALIRDGLWCAFENWPMGHAAEHTADSCGLSRAEQDRFSAQSHQRAAAAWASGAFDAEVVPVQAAKATIGRDEGIRADSTAEALAKLKPAFKAGGTVTAGNASQINDGAAAVVVMSADKARALGIKPLAKISAYAASGCAPEWVMMAPQGSITACAKKLGKKPGDFDLHEINEAFSAAAVALTRVLDLDASRVNVNGGAVALGHPIGASGARLLTTLLYAMRQRSAKTGMASLCLGGGNAVSMAVEAL